MPGATTAKAAASYSTDYQHELDLLELADMVNDKHPLGPVGTFEVLRLGFIPAERENVLSRLEQSLLPGVAELGYTVRIA